MLNNQAIGGQRRLLWRAIGLSVFVGVFSCIALALEMSGSGGRPVPQVVTLQAGQRIVNLRVLNVLPHGDWFFALQPATIRADGHWEHPSLNDDYPMLIDTGSLDSAVVGFLGTGYHARWFSSVNGQTYFLAGMADGTLRRYDVTDTRTVGSADPTLRQGARNELWVVLADDDSASGTGTSPTRLVLIAHLVSVTGAATPVATEGG